MPTLVIGNRNYSSWSLRAWLYLRESGLDYELVHVPMFTASWREQIARYSPAGRVPVFIDGDIHVWDTLAIVDYVGRLAPHTHSWPSDAAARARAWSISAEMHSGFLAVRGELPQNLRRDEALDPTRLSEECRAQIARIDDIWCDTRAKFGGDGPWLFGRFSVADVMYAPVALRFLSYGISVSPQAREFIDAVVAHAGVQEWIAAARAEKEHIEFIDNLVPAADAPLVLG